MPLGDVIGEAILRAIVELVLYGLTYWTGFLLLKAVTLGAIRLAPLTSIEEKNRSKKKWHQIDWSIWLHRPMQGRALKARFGEKLLYSASEIEEVAASIGISSKEREWAYGSIKPMTIVCLFVGCGALCMCESKDKPAPAISIQPSAQEASATDSLLVVFKGMNEGIPELIEVWLDNEFMASGHLRRQHIDRAGFGTGPLTFEEEILLSSFSLAIPLSLYPDKQQIEIRCGGCTKILFSLESLKTCKCRKIMVVQADADRRWGGSALCGDPEREFLWLEGMDWSIPFKVAFEKMEPPSH